MTGAIAMGSNKITGIANGTASTDAASVGQISQKLLQTVIATGQTSTAVSSSSYGATVISGSITPSSSSNRILIIVSADVSISTNNSDAGVSTALYRNGSSVITANIAYLSNPVANAFTFKSPFNFLYVDSPASTSALTYTIYAKNEIDNGASIGGGLGNGGTGIWSMLLQEIV